MRKSSLKSISTVILIASISAVFAGCSAQTPARSEITNADHFHIINGTKSASESAIARSTVYITTLRGTCTGILLNDHVVLTAGHCEADRATKIQLSERRDECSRTMVSEVVVPPTLEGSDLVPDIQLLKLESAVCKPASVVLAPAPKEGDIIQSAGIGYGTKPGAPDLLDLTVYSSKETLRALYLNDFPHDAEVQKDFDVLDTYYADLTQLKNLFAISKNSSQGSCNGDSGGPYFNEKDGVISLYGIHSAAFPHTQKGAVGCTRNNYLQVFTPVEPYKDWITQQLNKWQ